MPGSTLQSRSAALASRLAIFGGGGYCRLLLGLHSGHLGHPVRFRFQKIHVGHVRSSSLFANGWLSKGSVHGPSLIIAHLLGLFVDPFLESFQNWLNVRFISPSCKSYKSIRVKAHSFTVIKTKRSALHSCPQFTLSGVGKKRSLMTPESPFDEFRQFHPGIYLGSQFLNHFSGNRLVCNP